MRPYGRNNKEEKMRGSWKKRVTDVLKVNLFD
jgi:hypothetical protein